ncbi:MAG: Omp28-related outer membrane protein [Alistipes sp.]|nr:Omp28-related outer membrane protein [Alistipes sp.]
MKTLKTLALLFIGALAFVGCEPNGGDDTSRKGLILVADKTTIYDNGIDGATFTAYYDGMILTEGYDLYIGNGDEMVVGNKFTSTTQGTFEIWASYGTVISNTVNINVIATPPPAPAAPADPEPTKTNFVRRVLLTQFTGTGCGYCPYMINALYQVANDETLNSKVVFSAAHLFNETDPAYLSASATLDNAMGINSFPNLVVDLNRNTKGIQPMFVDVSNAINTALNRVAVKGGISVSSKYYADEEYIVVTATVKAKEAGEFRVGAWLLEDGIKANQGNNGITALPGVDFNTHNNCIRIADSQATPNVFSGYTLGDIEAGATASREFAFKLKPNGTGGKNTWNHDNLRVIVFISTKEGENWYVNNVVAAPKEGSVAFEYAE